MNGFEECLAGLLESIRRLVVTYLMSDLVEYFKTDTGFQIVFGLGQRFEFVIGGHHCLVAIDFALFSPVIDTGFREEAGTVEVDIGVQVPLIEVVDERREALRDRAVTEPFSDHRAVFAFSEGIVVGLPRTRLGELDE